tara:strand:- start:6208 stop:8931 length:2724 start_codon:yes stop_codon:yes gene_type:complete
MNQYPMKPLMDQMAQHGRYGDSMLVHMNPAEVRGIASLAPQGQLTINPVTGQPEAFLPFLAPLLGSALGTTFLGSTLTGALGSTLGTAVAGGIGSGLATAAVTGDLKRGLISGLIGAGTGAAFKGAADAFKGSQAALADQAVADVALKQGVVEGIGNIPGQGAGVLDAGGEIVQGTALPTELAAAKSAADAAVAEAGSSPLLAGAKSFGTEMLGAKAIVPTALGYGQLAQMDYEDQMQAAGMQVEEARQAELAESAGNLQRAYAAAQPGAMTGPSPYRNYMSAYTPDYSYASSGGIVSLAGGGQLKKYQAGGEFDPKVYAQSLPAGIREIYLKSNTGGYESLTEEEAATLSNYYSSAGAGLIGGKGGAINVPQTGTQGGQDTTPQEPPPPALPTSGYMRDPYTGAIVYLGGTRPGAGTPMEPKAQDFSGYMGGKGGMNMMTGGAGNPAYGGIDPVTIQANLRGQYAVTPPRGYALGFEPEFNYFQNDPFGVEVPYRGYYPQAFGPMQSGPYFHSSINMPNYLNQLGDYYRTLGEPSLPPPVQPPVEPLVQPPVVDPVQPPVVDTTPQGGIDDIVVGNYEGGERQTPQTLTGDDLYETYITRRELDRPGNIFYYDNKGDLVSGRPPIIGRAKDSKPVYYTVDLAHEDAEASFASKKQAMDYIRNFYGHKRKKEETGRSGRSAKPKASADKPVQEERTIPEHIRRAAERQAQQTNRPTGRGLSVTGASGKTTYFQEGGDVTLETSLGEVSTPAGGIANVETEFVKQQAPELTETDRDVIVLSDAILGRIENADMVVDMFVRKYGVDAFLQVRDAVLSSVVPNPQTEGMIEGEGGGMDDQVMGMIGDQQPVAVSPGEYIVPADVVSGLGDGSSDAGAEELDQMLDDVRRSRQNGDIRQPKPIQSQEVMPS